jgi:Spy/CpxP family protein refolding chaperone
MTIRPLVLTSMLAVSVLSASPVSAQRTQRDSEDRARLEERIRARMADIIRARLDLNESEEAELSAITREFEGRRRALVVREREGRERIDALLRADATSDAQADQLLDLLVTLRREEAELLAEEQERLRDILTPTQVLQLQHLRQELGRRIRAIRSGSGGDRDERPRRPGGGGGGSGR